jgi:hypothetical protein
MNARRDTIGFTGIQNPLHRFGMQRIVGISLWRQTKRQRQIGWADVHPIQPGCGENFIQIIDAVHGLDHRDAGNFTVRFPRIATTAV